VSERLAILLVEDDHEDAVLVTETIQDALDDHPYDVRHVATLREAQRYAGKHDLDVVLLDLLLPDSGGMGTVQAMHAAAPDARIIVLTGYDAPSLARQCIRAGAWDYIAKSSLDPEKLRNAVVSGIGRVRDRSGPR